MLHPERDPADPRFEEGDAQTLMLLQEAAIDDGGAGDQLLRRMRQGMDLQEIVEMAERVHGVAARGVKGDCDTLAGTFLVERPEIAVGDVAAAIEGVDHYPDGAELRDRPLHLGDRRLDVDMQR